MPWGPPPESVISPLIRVMEQSSSLEVSVRAINVLAKIKPFERAFAILIKDLRLNPEHSEAIVLSLKQNGSISFGMGWEMFKENQIFRWISSISNVLLQILFVLVGVSVFLVIIGMVLNARIKKNILALEKNQDAFGLLSLWKENPFEREYIANSLIRIPDLKLMAERVQMFEIFKESLADPKTSESLAVTLCVLLKKVGYSESDIGMTLLTKTHRDKLSEQWWAVPMRGSLSPT
jgi:hypothetical protein